MHGVHWAATLTFGVPADLYFVEASFVSNTVITGNTITAERGGIQIAYFLSGYPTYPGVHASLASSTLSSLEL